MKDKPLNTLVIYTPIPPKGLDVKEYDDYKYVQNGETKVGSVTRYAKNYSSGEKTYSLCLITQDSNHKAVEKWMDNQASKLEDVKPKLQVLDIQYS